MQTKQDIQKLLASAGVAPNHRRGQNFLIDLNLMRLLIDAAEIHSNDVVLEVGTGTGSLTEALAEKAGLVISVEIDKVLARIAEYQLRKFTNVRLIYTDILESKNTLDHSVKDAIIKARAQYNGRLMLVANLPYSVACPAMINLITDEPFANCMFVTVQKEVAERMTAKSGSKEYGPISIYLAAVGDIKILRTLKPTVFWPQPEVNSAMVSFTYSQEKSARIHSMAVLSEIVNLFMQHRRKMLKACAKFADGRLAKIHNWSTIFADSCVDPHSRPETLTPENYIAIANICSEFIKNL
ncbi:MAG: ribosomal RNA small subunit methyltransferase A [Candidatus Brocadiia bacterium]|nr:MAG: ribosomal RNA small subunit methyltransferase A [Candidatus Brocadiia bacterium]